MHIRTDRVIKGDNGKLIVIALFYEIIINTIWVQLQVTKENL